MPDQQTETLSRDPFEQLAEAFVNELRLGKQPSIEKYADLHPDLAEKIHEVFPLLAMMEALPDDNRTVPDRPNPRPSDEAYSIPASIGEYEIIRQIGRGGMGVVYEATHRKLKRNVALKLVPGNLAFADDKQLHEEATKLARVQHQNIVPLYEVGEFDGKPFFSMQLVDGSSLAARLKSGPLPNRNAADLLLDISRAITEAHRCGIVHRDLKPSNILMDRTGRPLVADFGLARFTDVGDLTASGVVAGTPSYMAPEQAMNADVGPSSDIYSLGAVLYEMLTGRPPFQAASPVETIMMVFEEDPLPPRSLNSKVDRDLEAIALKCLQKQPALRYETVEALASDLQAYVDDEPITASKYKVSDMLEFFRRETRFGPTLESWGAALIFQGVYLMVVYGLSAAIKLKDYPTHWPYYTLWAGSFPFWFVGFNWFRKWQGATTLMERQLSHLWSGGATICITTLVLEGTLRLPALILCPVYAIVAFTQSFAMANLLSRIFYLSAYSYLPCTVIMILLVKAGQRNGDGRLLAAAMALLAVIHCVAFVVPGVIYYRRYQAHLRLSSHTIPAVRRVQ